MSQTKQILFISFLFLALAGGWLWQQSRTVIVQADVLAFDEQEATIRAIDKAIASVVNVMVYEKVTDTTYDTVGSKKKAEPKKILIGQGTGFLISANGWIITNKHVAEASKLGNSEYTVVLNDGRKFGAFLIGKDPFNDLAVLRILGNSFPYLSLAPTSNVPVGTTVMAIGNALGKYQNSVTKGIISGLSRNIIASDKKGKPVSLDNVLQTDAEINQGNSGGPLINLLGQVVGVNVAVDHSGSSIGFAIPADDVRPVINSIIKYGRIVRPWLGVRYVMITPELATELGLPVDKGALLITNEAGDPAVVAGSPADKAGLKLDDIILEANGTILGDRNTLLSLTQKQNPGDKMKVKVKRGAVTFETTIILEEYK
ncbi:MAG: 2-alkenal reductase [Candidatus Falkowbacteria bacterium GW2011_GWA2_39_24]|uniref:2-alkenal reductase n=1 Tax=Candidatus Falkowbacteria bacterium GW2011_GWA2_39_24 TaxID=1618634 RepID=A0A0G0NQ22_9BACT|nr:MAG: 2-alkenal reductase [Candidatus Falkowbacteria bacterium GW2011_GWA2_39_24]